jgi:hypothetical protein
MGRDWAKEPEFTLEEIREALKNIQQPTFFGKLTLKSVGGRVTDLEVSETKKPRQ